MEPVVRCPHCGRYHNATLDYCPEKGLPIYHPKEVKRHSKPNLLWLLVVVVMVLIVACGAAAIYLVPRFLTPKTVAENDLPITAPTLAVEPLQTRLPDLSTPLSDATEMPTEVPATPTATPEPWQACPDAAYLSRLRVGVHAIVALDPPLPNRVRSQPNTNSTIQGYIDPGSEMEILEGPFCEGIWVWWRVRELSTDLSGWTVEGNEEGYWLEPVGN